MGIVIIFIGTVNILELFHFPPNLYTNIILVFIGTFIVSARFGVKLAFDDNKYKTYFRTFGIAFGKWKQLPRIEHFILTKIPRKNKKLRARNDELKFTEAKYKLSMVTFYKKKILVSIGPHQTLLDEAKIYANDLQVKIIDTDTHGNHTEIPPTDNN